MFPVNSSQEFPMHSKVQTKSTMNACVPTTQLQALTMLPRVLSWPDSFLNAF